MNEKKAPSAIGIVRILLMVDREELTDQGKSVLDGTLDAIKGDPNVTIVYTRQRDSSHISTEIGNISALMFAMGADWIESTVEIPCPVSLFDVLKDRQSVRSIRFSSHPISSDIPNTTEIQTDIGEHRWALSIPRLERTDAGVRFDMPFSPETAGIATVMNETDHEKIVALARDEDARRLIEAAVALRIMERRVEAITNQVVGLFTLERQVRDDDGSIATQKTNLMDVLGRIPEESGIGRAVDKFVARMRAGQLDVADDTRTMARVFIQPQRNKIGSELRAMAEERGVRIPIARAESV